MRPVLRFVLVFVALIAAALPECALADDWDLNKAPKPGGGDIVKLCEVGSTRMRYSNVPVPGYEPCGTLKTKAVCDAAGKKLIISADAEAPYGYLDCALGPRIVIERLDGPPDFAPPGEAVKGLEQLGKDSWLVGGQTPQKGTSAWKEYQEHVAALDRLLNTSGGSTGIKPAPDMSGTDPKMLAGALAGLIGGKAGGTKELEAMLKSLTGSGKFTPGNDLEKQLKELFPDK